jgi:hypothetical protein
MKGHEFKDAIQGLAKLMKALANPVHLEIIEMLSQGDIVQVFLLSKGVEVDLLVNDNKDLK